MAATTAFISPAIATIQPWKLLKLTQRQSKKWYSVKLGTYGAAIRAWNGLQLLLPINKPGESQPAVGQRLNWGGAWPLSPRCCTPRALTHYQFVQETQAEVVEALYGHYLCCDGHRVPRGGSKQHP